jgi:hypothetical protein
MTFWYHTAKGDRRPWPTRPQARYGPVLWSKLKREPGPHDHLVPDWLSRKASDAFVRKASDAFVRNWHEAVRKPWLATVNGAIDQDPDAAMARFAASATRCCICGRELTDPESKVNGIGPECIGGVPDRIVRAVRDQLHRILAEEAPETRQDAVQRAKRAKRKPAGASQEGAKARGENATIQCMDAVLGDWTRDVRKWWVAEMAPTTQSPVAVLLSWIEPRKGLSRSTVIHPETRYFLVTTADGDVIYDSRDDVPIDMDGYHATRQRFANRSAFRITHH